MMMVQKAPVGGWQSHTSVLTVHPERPRLHECGGGTAAGIPAGESAGKCELLFLSSTHLLPSSSSELIGSPSISYSLSRVGRRLQILLSCSGTWKRHAVISASSARRSEGECQGQMLLGSQLHWPLDHRFRAVRRKGGS